MTITSKSTSNRPELATLPLQFVSVYKHPQPAPNPIASFSFS